MMRYLCCHCTLNAAEFAGGKDLLSTELCDAGCPEVGPFVQPTEGTKRPRNGGVGWNLLAPWKRKTDSSTAPTPDLTPLRPWTGDLRPGEQWTRLPMNVFLNEGCEGRWPRHATIPIPINPSRTQAVEAQAANDSIPLSASWVLFRSAMAILPGQAVPWAAPTQPRATPILRGWRPPVECHHLNTITLKSTHPPLVIPIDKQQRLSRQQASFPVGFNLVAVRPPIATPPGAVLCSARAGGQSVGYGYAASASVPPISIRPRLLKHVCRGMATCRRTSRSSAVLHTARGR